MYVGWRDLKWAKGRFLLIGSVIVLITVLVGLLTGLTKGLGEQSTSAITGLETKYLVFDGDDFDSAQVKTDPDKDAVPDATPMGLATVRAESPSGSGGVQVIGVPAGSSVAPDAADVAAGKVVLSEAADELLGSKDLKLQGESYQVEATKGEASYSHMPVIWMTLDDWQKLTGVSADSATVLASPGPIGDLPDGYHADTLDDSLSAIGSYSAEHSSLLMIRGFLILISALVIGAFFTVWTIQRSRDIAVLKALGASTGNLVRDALGQAAVVMLIALSVGIAISFGLGALAGGNVPFQLDIASLAIPIALIAVLGLGGAAMAVRKVTTVDPLEALSAV